MATYVVTSDRIDGNEQAHINYLIEKLEAKGHTCESGAINPNGVQSYGMTNNAQGKIGIQIIGGVCGWTASDLVTGLKNGYYHFDSMALVGSSEFTGNNSLSTDKYHNGSMYQAHDAGGGMHDMYVGKSPEQFNEDYGEYVRFCTGDTFDEAIALLLGNTSNTEDEEGNNSSTYKAMILDLISQWSGQVLAYTINNKFYIHRIPLPTTEYKQIQEGVNIVDGSFKVTDINPDTTNVLKIVYNGDQFFYLRDENLIERFGEHEEEFSAVKYVVDTSEDEVETSTLSVSSDETTTTNETENTSVVEEPITDYDEAVDYGISKFYEIKADDGRSIDLEVLGDTTLKQGDWIQLYVPSFNEECFMFVSSVSTNLDSNCDFITSLTLVDAPPILSEPDIEEETDETSSVDIGSV